MDRDRIRALAEKAGPAEWSVKLDDYGMINGSVPYLAVDDGSRSVAYVVAHDWARGRDIENHKDIAAYMAACSPDVILALLDERDALEACRALVAWEDAEKAGPDYGTLTRDTHPQGETIWRRWWDDQSALCQHAFDTARAYLSHQQTKPPTDGDQSETPSSNER